MCKKPLHVSHQLLNTHIPDTFFPSGFLLSRLSGLGETLTNCFVQSMGGLSHPSDTVPSTSKDPGWAVQCSPEPGPMDGDAGGPTGWRTTSILHVPPRTPKA